MTSFFHDTITALITPFNEKGIDYNALERLIRYQAENGIKAIVVAGSTGEAIALTYDEYIQLSKAATLLGKKHNTKIIIGVGFSATHMALQAITDLNEIGPDAIMCTTPAYNKPTQEGMYQHFKELHDSSNMPIMLYSVPSRTGIDFTDETIVKLSKLPKIHALKDAGNDIERPLRLSKSTNLQLLSGEDSLVLAHLSLGGAGVVSVLSNVAPRKVQEIIDEFKSGNHKQALDKQKQLLELTHLLFKESNPIGVKCAANIMGLCSNILRMPLTSATSSLRQKIDVQLNQLSLK